MIKETVNLLGHHATDRVTGFSGVVTSVSFDLYGCVQVVLTPTASEDDRKLHSGHWFDVNRLSVSSQTVMPVPDFDARATQPEDYGHGAAPKPPLG